MKQTELIMGMPISVELDLPEAEAGPLFRRVFDYFRYVDEKFSTYKTTSEISRINRDELLPAEYSEDMKLVLRLCDELKQQTNGYFDIVTRDGQLDPSGLVKGWSIENAAQLLRDAGCKVFYIDAGGDVQADGKVWRVGIKNPFQQSEVVKVVRLENAGIATSGTYIRGQHIYDPHYKQEQLTDVVSLTVIGPNIQATDVFATAAFAMGRKGLNFIETLDGFEGYAIDKTGIATMTSGFDNYVEKNSPSLEKVGLD